MSINQHVRRFNEQIVLETVCGHVNITNIAYKMVLTIQKTVSI